MKSISLKMLLIPAAALSLIACGDDETKKDKEPFSFMDFFIGDSITHPDGDIRAGHTLGAALNPNWPDDMWIETRHVVTSMSEDGKSQLGYNDTVIYLPDSAGTVTAGTQICKFEFERTVIPVTGHDNFQRIKVDHLIQSDTCQTVAVGQVGQGVWEVEEWDAANPKKPVGGRRWLMSESPEEPTPEFRSKGGIAAPWLLCEKADQDANGLCPVLCANQSMQFGLPSGYTSCSTTL